MTTSGLDGVVRSVCKCYGRDINDFWNTYMYVCGCSLLCVMHATVRGGGGGLQDRSERRAMYYVTNRWKNEAGGVCEC